MFSCFQLNLCDPCQQSFAMKVASSKVLSSDGQSTSVIEESDMFAIPVA